MASINASTSGAGGVITTADNTGILNLQSAGNTIATIQPSGFSLPTGATINAANTFGFENRIINGAMVLDQRNAGASVSLPNGALAVTYVMDRWAGYRAASNTATLQQVTTAPTGFTNSFLFTNGTGITLASTESAGVYQRIEGYNFSDLGWGTANAKSATLSFWVNCSVTGTFTVSLITTSNAYSYPATYTIAAANTWQYVTISIPALTAGGSVNTTNGYAVSLNFDMGSGSTYSGTANTWQTGYYSGATGAVKLAATTGATMNITGVQLEVGLQATSFDFRDYGRELILCQRYFYSVSTFVPAAAGYSAPCPRKVSMRATPTYAGGGVGFTAFGNNAETAALYQTTGALQALTLSVEL
jgi:hypothetical protein